MRLLGRSESLLMITLDNHDLQSWCTIMTDHHDHCFLTLKSCHLHHNHHLILPPPSLLRLLIICLPCCRLISEYIRRLLHVLSCCSLFLPIVVETSFQIAKIFMQLYARYLAGHHTLSLECPARATTVRIDTTRILPLRDTVSTFLSFLASPHVSFLHPCIL